MAKSLTRSLALTAACLLPHAHGATAENLLGLLAGEYNNHEQVWQRNLDGVAGIERRHWRIERTGETGLTLATGIGQSVEKPTWELHLARSSRQLPATDADALATTGGELAGLEPETLVIEVRHAGASDPLCAYQWQMEGEGFSGEAIAGTACPAELPRQWRITPDYLYYGDDSAENETMAAARRVRFYSGWVSLQRRRLDPDAAADDFILLRNLRLHDEGTIFPITDAGEPTGYAVELARLTYQNTGVAVLKLGIVDLTTDKTLSYAWSEPLAGRIGINLRWIQAGFTRED